MTNNSTEPINNIELVKVISDNFYISFLSSAKKNHRLAENEIEIFEKYTNKKLVFNEKKFLSDARKTKAVSKFFKKLLPKELLTMNLIELRKSLRIINSYYRNIRKKKLQGGYIRAVLEGLYDRRFKDEFNKLKIQDVNDNNRIITNCLNEIWPYKESCFVLDYLNIAFYESHEQKVWNFSAFTKRKAIGCKRNSTYEKLNQYSAYKLYAQGEYSKLRIGLEKQGIEGLKIRNDVIKNTNLNSKEYEDNQEKREAYLKLRTLEKNGFEEIFEIINPPSYQNIKELLKEFPDNNKERKNASFKLQFLTKELENVLQNFKGLYQAFSLDDVLKTFYGYDEKETAAIEKEFSTFFKAKANFNIIDKIEYIKKQEVENAEFVVSMNKNTWKEIKEKREPKIDYRKLAKLRKIPDSYIFSTYELRIISKAYDDVRISQPEEKKKISISERIDKIDDYLSKNPEYLVLNYKEPLKKSRAWKGIKSKKQLSMAISLDAPVGDGGKNSLYSTIEDKKSSSFEKDIINENTMSPLKTLFKKEFPDDEVFLHEVYKELNNNYSSNSFDKENNTMLSLLDETFDHKHSWSKLWTIYKNAMNISENEDDEIRNDFRQKMSKIRNNIKNSSQEQLVK